MKYLTAKELDRLTPQRLHALLRSVKAKVGKRIDDYFDFEPERLSPELARLNSYRKQVQRLVNKKGRVNPPKKLKKVS